MILVRHGQSEFNVVFGATRRDPGIVDPALTVEGRRQIEAAASDLAGRDLRRIVASPYTRTLESAEILAEVLDRPVSIESIIRERCYFTCDIGSPRSELAQRWPGFDFGDLDEEWWPDPEETEAQLMIRCTSFRTRMRAVEDWPHVLVVSHWGFIRGLTGLEVGNGTIVPFDPTLD